MNRKWCIIILIILIILVSFGIYFYNSNHNKNNAKNENYEVNKTSTEEKKEENKENINNSKSEEAKTVEAPKEVTYKETPLADFSTKIYSKDSARQNNISITCKTLNGTIIKKRRDIFFL